MSRSRSVLVTSLLLIGVWLTFGCGSVRQGAQKQKEMNDLKQIGIAYHNHLSDKVQPPAKMEDLFVYLEGPESEPSKKLKAGDYVVIYGVKITDMPAGAANTVLGYHKDVPATGGPVLMGDASVQNMTADQFKGATLAKGK